MIVRVSVLWMVYSNVCKWEWRECMSVKRSVVMWEGREESVCCVMRMENGYRRVVCVCGDDSDIDSVVNSGDSDVSIDCC